MPSRPVDRLTRDADAARPDLGVRAVVVAERRPWWAPLAEGGVFVAVIVAVASTGLAGGPLVLALTAATAGACAAVVRGRVTCTDLIALGTGRAHLFDAERTVLTVRVGRYRGPLRRSEFTFVNGGRVRDEWALLGRRVRVLRVHRHLLDAVAGPPST
jgi:hypothetical protein